MRSRHARERVENVGRVARAPTALLRSRFVTQRSQPQGPTPEGVGALHRAASAPTSALPVRTPVPRVRLRVRVSADVLAATEQGLTDLDDDRARVLSDDAPPPVTF
ncbi:hypothetical protein Celf_0601 [Cellulomonas fimi ATCC 484]|uniref:Uncharacterized protein n=1 Tax=Cellulomonas fimi (strain ATCC 484 / DSM 20113 / JCM 1341 / CCUG 24087 / LMG 16345 / NBRC 15513 / NCIMB 8980 / NCTC 7547 / NRS-133) TaxID=590998 RepID=F4GY73_CELFA|nr:hypothetical protein Celf_0601 [Cellulomonas fimi ATCC 484]VEH27162.1 Uncharacterised protein [Cellulomonas fimi]